MRVTHTSSASPHDFWRIPSQRPVLSANETHVWRIPLDQSADISAHIAVLSPDEQERVKRFYFPRHGLRYAIAHSALRQILALYDDVDPRSLNFGVGEHGKPELLTDASGRRPLDFNLSHSGEMALVAVARHGAVGVDVERWRTTVEHLEIAERFFSPSECDALLALPREDPNDVLRGFFSTWARKEAYLKATGHGISRGLHHFDVTTGGEVADLLADRLDPDALDRWSMTHLTVGPGYSAALVAARPPGGTSAGSTPGAVVRFESPYI